MLDLDCIKSSVCPKNEHVYALNDREEQTLSYESNTKSNDLSIALSDDFTLDKGMLNESWPLDADSQG